MTARRLRVLSYNIHKGFSASNHRFILKAIKDGIRAVDADIVFLQEVVGQHQRHAEKIEEWPSSSQFEFLADEVWTHYAYGKNAVYSAGHHGNAILSAFPIASWQNHDISTNPLENRGLLHAAVTVPELGPELGPESGRTIHCFCVHMSLFHRGREKQIQTIAGKIKQEAGLDVPFILAGDFNDWRHRASAGLTAELNAAEVFQKLHGAYARTFPAFFPILRLDRIYVRGIKIDNARVLTGAPWSQLSDHLALYAEFELGGGEDQPDLGS